MAQNLELRHLCQKKMGHRWLNSPKKRAVEPSMSLKMTFFLRSSALVSPFFFYHIKLPFWDIDGATPGELRHLCGHLQPDFGEWVGRT